MDRIYVYLKERNGGVGRPEFRLREFRVFWFASDREFVGSRGRLLMCLWMGIDSGDGPGDDHHADRTPHRRLVRTDETTMDRDRHRASLSFSLLLSSASSCFFIHLVG